MSKVGPWRGFGRAYARRRVSSEPGTARASARRRGEPRPYQALLQRLPFQKLHDNKGLAVVLANLMDGADVGMIQCRGGWPMVWPIMTESSGVIHEVASATAIIDRAPRQVNTRCCEGYVLPSPRGR